MRRHLEGAGVSPYSNAIMLTCMSGGFACYDCYDYDHRNCAPHNYVSPLNYVMGCTDTRALTPPTAGIDSAK
mgnify:CR=1 FL=1